MNKLAWRHHFPTVYGKFFIYSSAPNFSREWSNLVEIQIHPRFYACPHYLQVEKDLIKNNREEVETSFSHYKSMGAFCCHGNQSFDPICPKTLCSLSLTPMTLHIKFDKNWPAGLTDIQVQKCGRRWTDGWTADHWYTISSPCKPSAQVS